MNITVCDICGEKVELNFEEIYDGEETYIVKQGYCEDVYREMDLCEKCHNEIKWFINSLKEKKKKKNRN